LNLQIISRKVSLKKYCDNTRGTVEDAIEEIRDGR